ncbi:uncharacterized protein F5147DRAFT_655431 [Suillus discolor]|uniref:Uncharacterized protein n=1 Tax=Suillus discolor TaxID=1912936 RepID=A0A9P7F2E4_9AGAM|nr:uncharacterized protein F5147DRAFT_655431 [Suillus discolor]KAG2101102.1 hypothetical protein F5147DRAFT_655431 [Suillus discolor]
MPKVWENIYEGEQHHSTPEPASIFVEVVPPQHRTGSHTNSVPEVHDGDHSYDNINNEFGMFGESLEEEYDECRVDNLYYPFTSKEEWEVADYLLRLSLSMAAIDEFLKLSMVQRLHLSFKNAKELRSHAEMLPSGPSSERLLRVYSEWLTGDSTWEMQTQLPRGATVLSAVLSSDKTNITTMTGARPLMKATEVGIMMSNPVGNVHHCFTPLAAYIIDTPEAAMLACFGDNFRHPAHTHSITLGQLASITVNSDDLEAYFEACADSRLNGVYAPFWMDWPLADPSVFLTPESLHHWHKEFYDHNLQWCIMVVGAQELDFQFSILQPTTGYRHFPGGISKLKQVTAPRRFVIVIHALMDLHYLVQCPAPDDNLLACIDRSLSTFHEHKDVILTLGARMGTKRPIENWHIFKLELLQSVTSSTRKVGTLIQWSPDATEHAHISEIKEPAWKTNNNDYDPQICRHLDWEEKLRHFAIATSLKSHPASHDLNWAEDILEEDDLDDGDEQETNDP